MEADQASPYRKANAPFQLLEDVGEGILH